jgi:PIN domain nuclease of toxin-antitoxin system
VRRKILAEDNEISVSAASFYEIGLKMTWGRLQRFPLSIHEAMRANGFRELSITPEHAERAASFPLVHRDPWDRILAAQAILEGMTVVTRDPSVAALGAPTLW